MPIEEVAREPADEIEPDGAIAAWPVGEPGAPIEMSASEPAVEIEPGGAISRLPPYSTPARSPLSSLLVMSISMNPHRPVVCLSNHGHTGTGTARPRGGQRQHTRTARADSPPSLSGGRAELRAQAHAELKAHGAHVERMRRWRGCAGASALNHWCVCIRQHWCVNCAFGVETRNGGSLQSRPPSIKDVIPRGASHLSVGGGAIPA